MNLQGLDVLIIGGVVALVGWGLKEVIKTLIVHLIQTMAKIEMLDTKLNTLNHAANEVPRLRSDVNDHARRLGKLEENKLQQ